MKWSMTEHFKEYLMYVPFVVRTDNNPLTYVLPMPNLDATGHRWVGALASFQFELEYQKGTDNGAADTLSRVPISHSLQTVQSLLKGVIVGAANRGEAEANEGLLEEHQASELGGKSSGGKAGAYAHSGLGTGPGGGCCPSQVPQVAPSQEGHATTQARYPPQGVPSSRS